MSSTADQQAGAERSTDQIRVITVDDHPAIREALADTIRSEMGMTLVGQAGSGEEAFALLDEQEPDVAVVDISLPDAHGLELIQNLHAQYEDVRVVIFSMYDEKVYAERAIRAGASGYVMKGEPAQLLDAIRRVRQHKLYLSRRMTSLLLSDMLEEEGHLRFPIDELTDREMEVFQMLGQGIGVKEIAHRLGLSVKTIEAYRRRAKEKLSLGSVSELRQYAIQWEMARQQMKDSA